MAKTLVTITIDTEASIAGAYDVPGRMMPNFYGPVDGAVNGRSEALGFLIETLQRFDIRATFFIETLHTRFFGDVPMADRCAALQKAGQDLQLHAHPTWRSFAEGKLVEIDKDDRSFGRPQEELTAIYAEAQDAFVRLTGKRAVAARSGNFATNTETFAAMRTIGINVTSNICIAVHRPSGEALGLAGGRQRIKGVLELPVSCFEAIAPTGGKKLRPLQITATGAAEMLYLLEQAHARDAGHVVILTHPFEFIKKADAQYSRVKANRLVQRRLTSLCRYLNSNRDRFEVVTLGECAEGRDRLEELAPVPLTAPLGATIRRMLENGINDQIWAL
jgi:hypothetical protein